MSGRARRKTPAKGETPASVEASAKSGAPAKVEAPDPTPAARRLEPHELALVEFHVGQRLAPEPLVAAELGLTPEEWGEIRRADPRVREAIARGRAREHQRLVASLYEAAVEEGNVNAAMFLLRARHGYDDKSADSAPRVNVAVIQLPAALSPDQWERVRAAASGRTVRNVTPQSAEGVA